MLSRDAAAMSRQAGREIMIAQGTGWYPGSASHAQYVFVMLRATAYCSMNYERRMRLLRAHFR